MFYDKPTSFEDNTFSKLDKEIPVFDIERLNSIIDRDIEKAVAILPSTAIYPQRLFCRELFVIGQS